MLDLGATTTWERFDPQWTDAGCLGREWPPVNAMNQVSELVSPSASLPPLGVSKGAIANNSLLVFYVLVCAYMRFFSC